MIGGIFLANALLIAYLSLVFGGIIWGIISLVKNIKRALSSGNKGAVGWYIFTVFCIIVAGMSWVFNMGWFRVILLWIAAPFTYTFVFFLFNLKAALRLPEQKSLNVYLAFSCITYLLSHLFFPDGGDIGGAYFFFGLVKNGVFFYGAMYLSFVAFCFSVAVWILGFVKLRKLKKQELEAKVNIEKVG